MNWSENDALFKKEVSEGHEWELTVLGLVRQLGLRATLADGQSVRETFEQRHEHRGTSDLVVEGHLTECKSRRESFTGPKDFPWPDGPFVDTVSNWTSKPVEPQFVICISRETSRMMVISSCTRDYWKEEVHFDSVRKIHQTFYVAPKHLWLPARLWAGLVEGGYADDAYLAACRKHHSKGLDGRHFDPCVANILDLI